MTKFELNQLNVKKDGRIILYQRPRKGGSIIPTWQMRISVPNSTGYDCQSTGEKEQAEAIRKSINTYEELYMKVLSGSNLTSKLFKDVYNHWKIDLPKMMVGKNRSDRYVPVSLQQVGNYPLSFFKDYKIDEI